MTSTDLQFINPKEVTRIDYGDFVGVSANNESPLTLREDPTDKYRFRGCMLVFFSANSNTTNLFIELVNSMNTQYSGIPVKIGWVNLTADSRIVNDIINTAETRNTNQIFKNLIPPYFILYIDRRPIGFINPEVFSVDGLVEVFRNNPNLCSGFGADNENKLVIRADVNAAIVPGDTSGNIYIINRKGGRQQIEKNFKLQLTNANQEAETNARIRDLARQLMNSRNSRS